MAVKIEVPDKCKIFKQEVEARLKQRILMLCINNGGECISMCFNQYCQDHGIKR